MSKEDKKVEQKETGLVQYSNPFKTFLGYLEKLRDSIKNKSWRKTGTRFTDTILALVRVEVTDPVKARVNTLNDRGEDIVRNPDELLKVASEYAKNIDDRDGNAKDNSGIINETSKEDKITIGKIKATVDKKSKDKDSRDER